ncbi:MAG: site-specific DNA-methyltransferase [Thermoleophilaceae bacterium]
MAAQRAIGSPASLVANVDIVAIEALRPSPWNPRTISASQLRRLEESLERDPELLRSRPVLALADGTIYAGNMRYRAAVGLGAEWRMRHYGADGVPAVLEDIPLEQAKERSLRDNAQWGEWIDKDLADLLQDLGGSGVPLDILGFAPDELERLLALAAQTITADDSFDPTPPQVAETRPGDLLVLGPHRLICGDSRDPDVWRALMTVNEATAVADAMWTDPPYGVDLQVDGASAIAGDTPAELGSLLDGAFASADRWLRPGASVYMSGPSGRLGAEFVRAWERVGWHLAQSLVWVKSGFVPGRSDYHHQHEAIYYGWKTGGPHAWIGGLDKSSVFDDEPEVSRMRREDLVALVKRLRNARTTDVIREDKTRHNDLHPTMKPTGLIRTMLANSTRRGAVVVDPFAGSGSTLIAAEILGRRVAAIELEPRFCDVIVRRWTTFQPGNTAVRLRGGDRTEIAGRTAASAPA